MLETLVLRGINWTISETNNFYLIFTKIFQSLFITITMFMYIVSVVHRQLRSILPQSPADKTLQFRFYCRSQFGITCNSEPARF